MSFAILLDMVAGINATFKREGYSDQYASELVTQIWNEADALDFSNYFVNQSGNRIIDDHLPLCQEKVPAIDIIDDFIKRFKPWHTSFDNLTFIDAKTLDAVGQTLESALFRLATTTGWLSNLSTINFHTPVIIFDLLTVLILLSIEIIHCKRKNLKNQIFSSFRAK